MASFKLSTARNDLGALVGQVAHFSMSGAPTGWLKCNGAAISRTTYSALFAVVGTTHGAGDGSTTFALPDLRGEFIRGWDDGRTVDNGRAFASFQADAFRAHNHTYLIFDGQYSGQNNGQPPSGAFNPVFNRTTGDAGGTETRPRNRALLACIKF